jgi:hypothetical protein
MPSVAGGVAAVVVALAIYAGSRGLRYFDAALVGYATATVFLAFGVTYRYAVWVSSPPAGAAGSPISCCSGGWCWPP